MAWLNDPKLVLVSALSFKRARLLVGSLALLNLTMPSGPPALDYAPCTRVTVPSCPLATFSRAQATFGSAIERYGLTRCSAEPSTTGREKEQYNHRNLSHDVKNRKSVRINGSTY